MKLILNSTELEIELSDYIVCIPARVNTENNEKIHLRSDINGKTCNKNRSNDLTPEPRSLMKNAMHLFKMFVKKTE